MTPIKIAILWHQHQPYYYAEGKFRLPWVRLHASKDYLEMAQHLEQHSGIHAMINLVPSLVEQIECYLKGSSDELLDLSRKDAKDLTTDEKEILIADCFHVNETRMMTRSERFTELYQKRQRGEQFSDEELRDLVIHYHLAWTGEFLRRYDEVGSLAKQDRNYSEEQKREFLDFLHSCLGEVIPLHKKLADTGRIEISTTPFYHPILPLLLSPDSAREAMHDVALPAMKFSSPSDAHEQVKIGKEYLSKRIGRDITGMWPSEGSTSDAALTVLAQEGIKWTASDEAVLFNSLLHSDNEHCDRRYGDLEKYFPRRYKKDEATIVVFFRDHLLSDKIGFDYHDWDANDAAKDFVGHIHYIRSAILERFGEEVLRKACISIILDGENCWEHYSGNGYHFLDAFYSELEKAEEIETVTFSEAVRNIGKENIRTIDHVVAGSWINGNFKIWIGHPEKNRAWELLAEASKVFREATPQGKNYSLAHRALLQAEGSDWFWWFGDDHVSSQKNIFDELFRHHLMEVYRNLGLPIPDELHRTILLVEENISQYSSMHRGRG